MGVSYIKHETISLKLHAELNEKWVQEPECAAKSAFR